MNQWFSSISCCDRMQKLVLKKIFLNKINMSVKEIIKKYFVIFHVNILKTVTIGDATLTPHEITWHQLAIVYAFIHLYLQHTHFLYLYLSSIFYFSNYCISLTNNKRGEKKIFYENRLTKFWSIYFYNDRRNSTFRCRERETLGNLRFSSTSYHFTLFILVARGTIWNIHTFLALQPLKLYNATLVWYVSRVHHNGGDARVFLFKGTTLLYDVNHSAS